MKTQRITFAFAIPRPAAAITLMLFVTGHHLHLSTVLPPAMVQVISKVEYDRHDLTRLLARTISSLFFFLSVNWLRFVHSKQFVHPH